MKKLLVVGLIGAAIVGGVVLVKAAPARSPEGKACIKMSELCGATDKSSEKLDQCIEGMESAKKVAGAPAVERSMKCVEESTTCMAATGCMMGGVGVGALGEFAKGFGTAISK
jgi:hypothetical protein